MAATELINLIEQQGLLEPDYIGELRRQVEQSKSRITPEAIAKLLVENGQLTRFQAQRLIAQINDNEPGEKFPSKPFSSVATPKPVSDSEAGLDLLPPEYAADIAKQKADGPLEARIVSEQDEVEEIVELDDAEIIDEEDDQFASKPKRSRGVFPVPPAPSDPADALGGRDHAEEIVRPVKIKTKANNWDAFRIWGVGFTLLTLVVLLAGLMYWLISGGASEAYARAEAAYGNRDYEKSIELFKKFAISYPSNDNASKARVLTAIATIREANEHLGDPERAIDLADEVLPNIVNEKTINDVDLRSDLASALVAIAEKIVQRADGAKTKEERRELAEKLDKHLINVRNPQYIPNTSRITNESRIKGVEEDRERILRDIQRAEDLAAAIEKMQESISKADVDSAYQARRTVVRKYPQLERDAKLLELLKEATSLQQAAVKPATNVPTIVDPTQSPNVGRSSLLVKRSGTDANVAPETIVYVRAKGSVYALKGTDGTVVWRKYVGLSSIADPIRLSSDPSTDCLVVQPDKGRLARLQASDGTQLWEIDLGSRVLHPSVDGDIVYASTEDGRIHSIDASSGQSRWSKQIPQKMEVGVGGGANKPVRYAVGNHSNLYVLSRNDGSCSEVYYLGHSAGTVVVPPLYALGQLIVFENAGAGYCSMRILKTNDQGGGLDVSQTPIRLDGHVVVPPSLDGRRLVVMTDLGQVVAFDIEPASNADKVNRLAELSKNEKQPKIAWPLVAGNDLWVVSTRFARYQIQVSRQKLVPEWGRDDEDQFTTRPYKMEDYVVHARTVRGTQGIRITAANMVTGDPVWFTDLGVPVVAAQAVTGGSIAAINSQAALYKVDGPALSSGKPLLPSENAGRDQRAINFESPLTLANGKIALLNKMQNNQVAVLDPKASAGNTFQLNLLQINEGLPWTTGAVVGNGIIVPLNNSQLAYLDPTTGKQIGAPFQPPLESGVKTRWLPPVVVGENIIAATDQKKIYRLSSGKQLRALSETVTNIPFAGQLAAAGDIVCAVGRGDAQDSLELYNATNLTKVNAVDVDGRVTWGPYGLDDTFYASSETSGLVAIDKDGKTKWSVGLNGNALVGAPVIQGEDLLISSASGSLFRIAKSNGEMKAEIQTGEPLNGSPVLLGSGILLPGNEGAIIAIPLAKTMQSSSRPQAEVSQ